MTGRCAKLKIRPSQPCQVRVTPAHGRYESSFLRPVGWFYEISAGKLSGDIKYIYKKFKLQDLYCNEIKLRGQVLQKIVDWIVNFVSLLVLHGTGEAMIIISVFSMRADENTHQARSTLCGAGSKVPPPRGIPSL